MFFLQNLDCIKFLIDFDTSFHKKQESFTLFWDPSPHHQKLWTSGFLNMSSLWIRSDNILWQSSVISLTEFPLNREWHLNSIKKTTRCMHQVRRFNKALHFFYRYMFNRVSQDMSYLETEPIFHQFFAIVLFCSLILVFYYDSFVGYFRIVAVRHSPTWSCAFWLVKKVL